MNSYNFCSLLMNNFHSEFIMFLRVCNTFTNDTFTNHNENYTLTILLYENNKFSRIKYFVKILKYSSLYRANNKYLNRYTLALTKNPLSIFASSTSQK